MRVLVHLNSLELGGTQLNAVDFAQRLRRRGVESLLVGARAPHAERSPLLEVADARSVAIEEYDPAPGLFAHARQLNRIADRFDADLVHVYGTWGGSRPTFWGPALGGRRPWVLTVYEMVVSPVVHRHMPLVVGTGYLLDEQSGRPGRTALISPPVDLDADRPDAQLAAEFRRQYDLGDGTLLVIVSRLDPNMKSRSIGIAVDAMAALADRGVTLAVVGTGESAGELGARADAVNSRAGRAVVRMIGALADPRPAYAAADVVLGMGSSAARGLAFGAPLVVQGEAGWSARFEPSTAAALARSSYWSPDEVPDAADMLLSSLEPLLDDPALRTELGAYGRAFAVERFGLDAMTDQLDAFYRHAVDAYSLRRWVADLPREAGRLSEKVARLGRKAA